MKRLMLAAAAALVCACTPPATKTDTAPAEAPMADAAGNRMEALSENAGRWCTGDGVWCVGVSAGMAAVSRGDAQVANITVGEAEVWPHIIRLEADRSVLVGLVSVDQQVYSGGGASARRLSLFDIAPGEDGGRHPRVGRETTPVLTGVPVQAEAMIRACFTEEHAAARQEACHDEYDFTGTISLDTSVARGSPRLILTTEATSFPGQRTRASDSTTEQPLQSGDLVRWRDETCSYRRVATWEGDAYVWDAPLPACADYLEP